MGLTVPILQKGKFSGSAVNMQSNIAGMSNGMAENLSISAAWCSAYYKLA
jgi:hypothetical protein